MLILNDSELKHNFFSWKLSEWIDFYLPITTTLLLWYLIAFVALLHFPFFQCLFPSYFNNVSVGVPHQGSKLNVILCSWQTQPHSLFIWGWTCSVGVDRLNQSALWNSQLTPAPRCISLYCSSLSPYHSISALFIYFYLYLFYTQSYSLILNKKKMWGNVLVQFFLFAPPALAALLPFLDLKICSVLLGRYILY